MCAFGKRGSFPQSQTGPAAKSLIFKLYYIKQTVISYVGVLVARFKMLHNEELYDPYPPANVIRFTRWLGMRWAGHVARVRAKRAASGFWWKNPRRRSHLEDLGVDGRVIWKWMLEKRENGTWTGIMCCCERCDEPPNFVKCGEFL